MRGATLIEVILGILVLSLTLMAVLTLFPSSLLTVKSADTRLRAEALAQSLLEEHKARSFDSLVINSLISADVEQAGVPTLHTSVEIHDVPGSDRAYLKEVRVVVSWASRSQQPSITRSLLVHNVPR